MDLKDYVDEELVQTLRGAITVEKMIATRQLIDSVGYKDDSTANKQVVHLVAMNYLIELRDGEQYKRPPTLQDIETWIEAKGLTGILDARAVLSTINVEGTSWDKKGGSALIQDLLSKQNIKRVLDLAVKDQTKKILSTSWRLR